MKRVLITGASGFIGRHCPASLQARGYEVHAVSSKSQPTEDAGDGVRWHRADLLDARQLSALLDETQPTDLLHLAWYAAPRLYWTSTENFRWVQASLNLLEGFAARGGRRAVVAGTCAEYDWRHTGRFFETETPLAPSTLYGASKRALHLMLDAFARQAGLSAAWGYVFFLYGEQEHSERLVASVVRALLKDEPALCSHGRQVRDFLHVADVADAFVALLDSRAEGAVNVASGEGVSLAEVVLRIGEKLGRRELIRLGARAASADEPPTLVADVSRLRDEVGWRPRIDLDAGLERTIRWWRNEMERERASAPLQEKE
ncbi:MAG TPA: NAD(P)-dependent oxidoreductase [Pyrinomonadaceae bacterium]|jgi:nucleoside-diphosphate-sugar epimerase